MLMFLATIVAFELGRPIVLAGAGGVLFVVFCVWVYNQYYGGKTTPSSLAIYGIGVCAAEVIMISFMPPLVVLGVLAGLIALSALSPRKKQIVYDKIGEQLTGLEQHPVARMNDY